MKLLSAVIFSLSLFLLTPASARVGSVKIVAVVNGDIISSEDIQNRINAFLMTTQIPLNSQTKNLIFQKVLNAAIDEKVKLQEAERNGIEITPADIKTAVRAFERNNNIPAGQMKNLLRQNQVSTETFESQIKSDLAWLRLVRQKMLSDSEITQKEIEETQAEAQSDLKTKKYQVSEIFIRKDKAKNLDALVSNLRSDDRFALYAMQFSDSPSSSNGGNLGWVNEGKLAVPLERALRKMKNGEVSDPILVGDGYYILKLERTFDPKKDKPEVPTQEEIRRMLENQRMEAFAKKRLQELRQDAVIEIRG